MFRWNVDELATAIISLCEFQTDMGSELPYELVKVPLTCSPSVLRSEWESSHVMP